MRWKWCAPPACLLLVVLPWIGVSGCGDDSDSADLTGIWVAYQLLIDGNADPDGGTNGIGGAVLVLNEDGSGMSIDPEWPDQPAVFTWSQDGDTFTMVSGSNVDDMTCHREGDCLTLLQADGSHSMRIEWQLHRGAELLIGTWDLVSLVDDNGGVVAQPPGQLSYVFDGAGRMAALIDGQQAGNTEYFTDGPGLWIGPLQAPYQKTVFTVVGTTLFLFEYRPGDPEDQLLVWRFTRR